ncbi:hypothetical protein DL89DRAFT_65375 [Linderina pennispora]|uniref:Uncharacterized protein n=1 Tax=Linderina pennispora TaxID=61395 RepID=A0A1Y1VZA7_9FUNG|nr:uncharacterized protein DL89DRAFT_65375 [Linderina pennispora]ORX66591.1 hypothetical protein DL89DRAFT_65375 [Linderina pennispora]
MIRLGVQRIQAAQAARMIQPVARHMSTEQPPAKDGRKKTPRSKYMGVRPESPAIVRMADSFAEAAPSFDIVAELDAFRFSSEDLIRQLPAVRTQLASDASVSISPAELAATNRKETLDLLNRAAGRQSRENQGCVPGRPAKGVLGAARQTGIWQQGQVGEPDYHGCMGHFANGP